MLITLGIAGLANLQDLSRVYALENKGKLPKGYGDTALLSSAKYMARIAWLVYMSKVVRRLPGGEPYPGPTVYINGVRQA